MPDPTETPIVTLARKYFDEHSLQFRAVWELYLSFYVAFITLNGAALGLTVQYVKAPRAKGIIAITFILQNALAAGTAIMISRYSDLAARRTQELGELTMGDVGADAPSLPPALRESPIPGHIGRWGGIANLLGHILFAILWSVVGLIDIHV